MSLQDSCALSILIQVLLCRDFEDVIKITSQLTLTLGDSPGVPGSVQCCHLRPQEYKWKVEDPSDRGWQKGMQDRYSRWEVRIQA